MRKPVSPRPRPDARDEGVVGRPAQRLVEVLHDRDGDAVALEPGQPLLRVAQEGRRGAGQDLVRVVVEGQDGRSGVQPDRGPPQLAEQVEVAAVEPVEDADGHEERPVSRPQGVDARQRVTHRASRRGRAPRRPCRAALEPPSSVVLPVARRCAAVSRRARHDRAAPCRSPGGRRPPRGRWRPASHRARGAAPRCPATIPSPAAPRRSTRPVQPPWATTRCSAPARVTAGRSSRPAPGDSRSSASRSSAAAARTSSSAWASARVNGPDAVRRSAPRYPALPTACPRSRASART